MAAPPDAGGPSALYEVSGEGGELSLRRDHVRRVREWFRARAADPAVDLCERQPGSAWPAFLRVERELGRGHYGTAAAVRFVPDPVGAPLADYYVALKRIEVTTPARESEVTVEIEALQMITARINLRAARHAARERVAAHFPRYYFHWHCMRGWAGALRVPRHPFMPHETFVVMSLMDGRTLLSLMLGEYRERRAALDVLPLVRAVLHAVAEACYVQDALGVRHLDSHGGNIVIADEADGFLRAQFIDFGRAEFTAGEMGRLENGTNFMDFLVMMLVYQQLPTEVGRALLAALFTADTREVLAMRHEYRWFGVADAAGRPQWNDVYAEYADGRATSGDVERRRVLLTSAFATAGGVSNWIGALVERVANRLIAAAASEELPPQ